MDIRLWKSMLWIGLLAGLLLAACRPAVKFAPATAPAERIDNPPPTATPTRTPSPTATPRPTSTPRPVASPTLSPTAAPTWPPPLRLPYTPTDDAETGRIRGQLFYPSEFIPALTVYAVAVEGGRFYRVDTGEVPPGQPSYEIIGVAPGLYHVYAYPSGGWAEFGGSYSYLAACEAGHWEWPQACADFVEDSRIYELAPVEVRAGQAVEEVNIYDWYGPSLPPPPDGNL